LNHTIPHILAGCLILQPVSVPSAAGTIPEATAEALHELDQPGILVVSHGFFVILRAEFSQLHHIANSSRLSLPELLNQDFFRLDTIVES